MLARFSVTVREGVKKIQLDFKYNLNKQELDHLLKLINNLGWFVSSVLVFRSDINWKKFNYSDFIENEMDRRWLSFQLEAKFDLELNIHDYDEIYHISPSVNKDKILRIGLVPKSKEKKMSHPERIYFAEENDMDSIGFQVSKAMPNIPLSIFKIDFRKAIRHNPSIRLFDDPNFHSGFFTLSNIPPQFISWEGELNI